MTPATTETIQIRCSSTELAVPECSCQTCLLELMQANAPWLIETEPAHWRSGAPAQPACS